MDSKHKSIDESFSLDLKYQISYKAFIPDWSCNESVDTVKQFINEMSLYGFQPCINEYLYAGDKRADTYLSIDKSNRDCILLDYNINAQS